MKPRFYLIILAVWLWPAFLFSQNVKIGDILCTDGSTISAADFPSSGRTAEGIVFYVNENGHGWAVSLECQAVSTHWVASDHYYEMFDIPGLENFDYSREAIYDLDGYSNTEIIRNAHGADWYPAAWSVDFNNGWYLPAAGQLRWLMAYINEVNNSLAAVQGTMFIFDHPRWYWTSTERGPAHAIVVSQTGSVANYPKWNYIGQYEIGVRAVKSFAVQAQPPTIGEIVTAPDGQRGVVFYVDPDDNSYWLAAMYDLSSDYQWGLANDLPDLDNYNENNQYMTLHGVHCGYDATRHMREAMGTATQYASSHVDIDHGWHIPSAGQLSKLFAALPFIETVFTNNGGTSLNSDSYWTSTECSSDKAWTISFGPTSYTAGILVAHDKSASYAVRPVWSQSCEIPLPEPTIPDNIIESDCNQPLQGTPWDIQMLHSSTENDIASYSPIVAGDINGDGVTEIVVARYSDNAYHSNGMYVFSGLNLSVQSYFDLPDTLYNYNGYALGRYPLDNGNLQGAIFIHSYDKRIRAYAVDGTLLNVSDRATSCDGMLSLADFNGDGFPEIYSGNDIFDAATLRWLCSGPANGNKGLGFRGPPLQTAVNTHHTYYAMSLAYNVLSDARQELICGNTIYDVNIVSRTNPALNSITVNKTITPPTGFTQDGHVLIADFDLDGESEVIVFRDNTDDHTLGNIYIYAYKPTSGQILFQKSHYAYCTSYPFIGNIDDDIYPEIVLLEKQQYSPAYLFCWRFVPGSGLTTVWQQEHDDSSGQTGITLFDFNQDGIMELVYRDNRNLRILNGSGKSHITGNDTIRPYDLYHRMMGAGTGVEYPIVADVNSDGYAEIVATGLLGSTQEEGYGGIFIFGNPGNWSPSRPVWNQYMYHVTNVNEDLTIPTYCFDKATVFTAQDGTERRPYNNFLQQAYYITPEGEPYNPGEAIEVSISGSGCETYTFHGTTYTESGHYEQLVESEIGCDTLYQIEVSIGGTVSHEIWQTHCKHFTWNDETYYESGDYQQSFISPLGCDSIVTLHLSIIGPLYHEWSMEVCDHYTWNGTTYSEPGDYVQEFVTPEGCDSIVTLHLAFSDVLEVDTDTVACGSLWWNGQEYTESGHYEQQFVTPGGCDSLVRMELTVLPFPDTIPEIVGLQEVYVSTDIILGQYNYFIDSVAFATHYEWILEGPDWIMDTTGTQCSLWVTLPGTATLKARAWNGCGYTEQHIIIHAGFFDIDDNPTLPFAVYPNPAHDKVFIEAEGIVSVRLFDLLGQCLAERSTEPCEHMELPLQDYAASIYLIEIQTQRGTIRTKLKINPE